MLTLLSKFDTVYRSGSFLASFYSCEANGAELLNTDSQKVLMLCRALLRLFQGLFEPIFDLQMHSLCTGCTHELYWRAMPELS